MFYYIYQFEILPMWNGNPIKLKTEMPTPKIFILDFATMTWTYCLS